MKNKKYKWLAILPVTIATLPLIALSCSREFVEDDIVDVEVDDYTKTNLDYSKELLYQNLNFLALLNLKILGQNNKLNTYEYIDEIKPIIVLRN
ncbi:hypothetical protein HGG64_01520 [Mycoplasma phocoeninasale]|uniref:Lipoprotein n=1 Tax=Mycoplasma phocoeninasale TaxID=2726117 RepID=A0A858U4Q5_9MOLU|nr:hypothetical protein [Mycoplasma phocoeninasale]QJG66387.1 hypothetical protein HGG64_01520 [Mycoplasma phocoeninasale]